MGFLKLATFVPVFVVPTQEATLLDMLLDIYANILSWVISI